MRGGVFGMCMRWCVCCVHMCMCTMEDVRVSSCGCMLSVRERVRTPSEVPSTMMTYAIPGNPLNMLAMMLTTDPPCCAIQAE